MLEQLFKKPTKTAFVEVKKNNIAVKKTDIVKVIDKLNEFGINSLYIISANTQGYYGISFESVANTGDIILNQLGGLVSNIEQSREDKKVDKTK